MKMVSNITKKAVGLSVMILLSVTACQPATDTTNNESNQPSVESQINTATASMNSVVVSTASATNAQANTPQQIDWQAIDSHEKAVDPATFKYPFELDSEPVKIYAKDYQIDNQTARYQMTVGMAVNEVLSKLLDQLNTNYASHEMTMGEKGGLPVLLIHTTKNVEPSEADYVFAGDFAKGLRIHVKVVNDGIKQKQNPHKDEE